MDINKRKNYIVKGNKLTRPLPPIGHNGSDDKIQNYFQDLIRGCINFNELKDSQPHEVRIFLSSTFTDFKSERNMFIKQVIPELQPICNKYGLNLCLCDMRWGVTDSAVNEHLVEKLCVKEIGICRKNSIGPFFVLLLGNRYGYQPIPSEIPSSEFNVLYDIILENFPKEAEVFAKWFQKDENSQPPLHVLLPIKTHIPKYAAYEDEIKRREAGHEWWKIEESIRRCLNKSCKIACDNGLLMQDRRKQLTRSVTESELWSAVEGKDSNINKQEAARCLAYERHLNGLMNDLQSEAAIKYIDYITRDDEIICESSSQLALSELKNSIHKMGLRQFRKFVVPWSSSGITEELMSHKTYLDKLAKTIVKDIKEIIIEQMNSLEKYSCRFDRAKNNLQSEIIHHWQFCIEKSSIFCGRLSEIENVLKLMCNGYRNSILIHGDSGCGKTAFMSKIARILQQQLLVDTGQLNPGLDLIHDVFRPNQIPVIILRYLGTTSFCTTVQQLLFSICFQIQLAYNLRVRFRKMTSLSSLHWLFNHLIHFISRRFCEERPLIIILDSIDQLFDASSLNNYKINQRYIPFDWIPIHLPPGVFMILSVVTDTFKRPLFQKLGNRLFHTKDHFIQINSFAKEDVKTIFEVFQRIHSRKLTDSQMSLVIPKLLDNPQALFIKVILEQTISWPSFLSESESVVATTIDSALELMFLRLENQFGLVLISYTLGYLTLGLNGLSETEIEDLLSLQDDVLNEVYQYHDPPNPGVIRLPSLLWSRIRSDLSGYVAEKRIDGKLTLSWYHRQIHECATKRYAKDPKQLHFDLSNYYSIEGVYRKSCTLNNHKRHIHIPDADRLIHSTQITDREPRKMHALSYHLIESGQDLKLCRDCVANLNFLVSFAQCFSVQELILWLKSCEKMFPENRVISSVKNCVIFIESLLEVSINNLAIQLLGQLNHLDKLIGINETNTLFSQSISTLQSLCDQCKLSFKIGLLPSVACFPSCLGSIKVYKENVYRVIQLPLTPHYVILIGYQNDEWIVRLFQPSDRVTLCSFKMENMPVTVALPSRNQNCIFIQDCSHILMYDTDTSQLEGKYELFVQNKILLNECMAVDHHGKWISVAAQNRIAILENKTSSGKCLISYKSVLIAREVDKTLAMCFIQSGKHALLLSAHNYNSKTKKTFLIKIWQFELNNELWSIDLQSLPNNYGDFIYLWPFTSEKIDSDCIHDGREWAYNEPVLIVLPNGLCYFISNLLDHKSIHYLTKSESSKSQKEKLRSLSSEGNIVTLVRIVGNYTVVQKIDRKGEISTVDIHEQINSNLISFVSSNSPTNSLSIGLKSGLIYYISNDTFLTWTAHRAPVDYIALSQSLDGKDETDCSLKITTFSHVEKVIKGWAKSIDSSTSKESLSKTKFEEMSSFAFSPISNRFVIMNENCSVLFNGIVEHIGSEFSNVDMDSCIADSEEHELRYTILDMEIVLQDQAVLIFYQNKIQLINLSNGQLWSSLDIGYKNTDQQNKIGKKQYWNCLHNHDQLLLLTFKKSTGYFNLDCHNLPTISNIRWSKRFLPPINFLNPEIQLETTVSISNVKQNFLVLLWKNAKLNSNVAGKDINLISNKISFHFTSLNLQDPPTTLCLVPCFNQEEFKKVTVRNSISKTANQSAFSFAIPNNIPSHYPNDFLLNSSILLGGFGEILIWDMESGSCRLPKVPNFQTWFKHSAIVNMDSEINGNIAGNSDNKPLRTRISSNVSAHQVKKYPITALLITNRCVLVISGCASGFVIIWRWAETVTLCGSEPEPVNKFRFVLSTKHKSKVTSFAVTLDQKLLASGSASMELFLSDITTNQCLHKISIHCCPISLVICTEKDCESAKSPKSFLICKAVHIGQIRMLAFDIIANV